jgi:hypothetical protein
MIPLSLLLTEEKICAFKLGDGVAVSDVFTGGDGGS